MQSTQSLEGGSMARKLHRGAFRTALEYVLVVMGGTALLITLWVALGANWYFDLRGYIHPGFRSAILSGADIFLTRLVTPAAVLIWLFVGALLYIAALILTGLLKNNLFPGLGLGAISMVASGWLMIRVPPAVWPSLPALYFMMLVAGLLGGAFGVFLPWRVRSESFQTSPLGWGHRLIGGVWVAALVSLYGYAASATLRVRALNDPTVDFIFVKWSPAEGDIREVPVGPYDSTFPQLKELEIEELRAAGLTGTLMSNGNNYSYGSASKVRMVIVMSRGLHETVELRKPESGDILYIQTEEGWKPFPPSAPTVSRTVRLTYTEANVHQTYPSTNITADMGLGHPNGAYGIGAFSWKPEEFQAPLPSLAAPKPVSQ
jgi:hypothetical protein